MTRVAQQLAGGDAEAPGAVQHALTPRALVDHAVGGARVGQVDQAGNRELHAERRHRFECGAQRARVVITDLSRAGTRVASRGGVTTMLDWISLGAGLVLGLLALVALVLTILGVFVLGRGVL